MKLVLVAVTSMMVTSLGAMAQDVTHVDARTPREAQVRIAKLAAPKEIADHADIYVLGQHGYELAQRGDNGFSCMIEREKANTMEPECYDAEGTRTTVKVHIHVEKQRAKGVSDQQIERCVKAGYKSGKFRPPSKPGIVYMLSDYNYVLDPETGKIIRFPGHLMFYAPYATEKTIGSGEGAPYIVHLGEPEALMIVVPQRFIKGEKFRTNCFRGFGRHQSFRSLFPLSGTALEPVAAIGDPPAQHANGNGSCQRPPER